LAVLKSHGEVPALLGDLCAQCETAGMPLSALCQRVLTHHADVVRASLSSPITLLHASQVADPIDKVVDQLIVLLKRADSPMPFPKLQAWYTSYYRRPLQAVSPSGTPATTTDIQEALRKRDNVWQSGSPPLHFSYRA
jgi:hypothetical protein